jgi:hypothetical protein
MAILRGLKWVADQLNTAVNSSTDAFAATSSIFQPRTDLFTGDDEGLNTGKPIDLSGKKDEGIMGSKPEIKPAKQKDDKEENK